MAQVRRRVRRSPNFVAFLVTGGVVGFVVGAVIALTGPDASADGYSGSQGIGFLGLTFAALGALAFGVVAALLDRRR